MIEAAHSCSDRESHKAIVEAIVDCASKAGQHSVSIHNGNFFIAETPEQTRRFKESLAQVPC